MARKEKVAGKNKAPVTNKAISTLGTDQYYGIRGTSYVGQTKEELKAQRRELNHAAGAYEVETTIEGKKIEATPSNQWPYRITKTRAHPHNNPVVSAEVRSTVNKAFQALAFLNS